MDTSTTIKLHREVVMRLTALKNYPRETYEDVIVRLMGSRKGTSNGKKR